MRLKRLEMGERQLIEQGLITYVMQAQYKA